VTSGVPASAGTPAATAATGTTVAASTTIDNGFPLLVPSRVIYPGRVLVTAVVTAGGARLPGATVTINGRAAVQSGYTTLFTGTTNASGVLSVSLWIGTNTWYFASASKAGYTPNTSNQHLVYLYPRIGIGRIASSVARGSTLLVTGNVLPTYFGELPVLQLLNGNVPFHWVATASSCDRYGNFVIAWKVPANRQKGTFLVRVILTGNQLHAQATSSNRTLVIT
jgi:hypothetical protein